MNETEGRNARVYAVVQRIPRGRVLTYGQVAAAAGLGAMARQVGYALHALPDHSPVPWHRVVNARGEISRRSVPGAELEQRIRLELEGVKFDARGRVRREWLSMEKAR
ncbi:MGMT family protein [Aquincola sp. S2]|uniref:MGMT family protein n=2 Tax=Pseudaquabacterium terrae TaxID=2732868 RepID=A0ABX2ENX8_9BURK|nr:MGMT family protein [Aquabacterium terrae]